MKIVLIVDWHSEKMGYSDNCIPKFLADAGHEVHLISSNAQCYYDSPNYEEIFGKFNGPGLVDIGVKFVNGYKLHRLPFKKIFGKIYLLGLYGCLKKISPEVVQGGEITSLSSWQAAVLKIFIGYKFFIECHWHFSVFPIKYLRGRKDFRKTISKVYQSVKWFAFKYTIGKLISIISVKCFPIATDSAALAENYFGFPKNKIVTVELGVDTLLFKPLTLDLELSRRRKNRRALGYSDEEIVCVYTGRLTEEKGPHLLAEAVSILRGRGLPYRALFIGDGPKDYVDQLRGFDRFSVREFMPYVRLPKYYQLGDIGVWPKQESTSQLDAMACGLPLILSDRILTLERIDGSGTTYLEGNALSLASVLEGMKDLRIRENFGKYGAKKIKERYSWELAVKKYVTEYDIALQIKSKEFSKQ